MAESVTISAGPEGVDILRSDNDGRIYVINEVLNFYQRNYVYWESTMLSCWPTMFLNLKM